MRVTDIVNSAKLTVRQIFSCPTVQHFQFELLCVSAALTQETGTAMVLVCRHPTSDEAVSDAVFGCEDFVSPFAREVVTNHFQFEPEVEFPHMPSKVVSNSWGSVQTRGDSLAYYRAAAAPSRLGRRERFFPPRGAALGRHLSQALHRQKRTAKSRWKNIYRLFAQSIWRHNGVRLVGPHTHR